MTATPPSLADVRLILAGTHPALPGGERHWAAERRDRVRSMFAGHVGDKRVVLNVDCWTCHGRSHGVWTLAIRSNGIRMAVLRCVACWTKLQDCAAAKVSETLPVWADARATAPVCERCGSTDGTELHHWAPNHLFHDAHDWPTSYLCRWCHALWHRMITPNMGRRSA